MTVVLNRFISRSADRCKPFFSLINKWKDFEWNEECALAFQQLKDYLSRPPIMSSPEPDEVLFAYIAVVPHAVSLVLIRVDQGVQRPVYCVSKSLHEAEIRYLPLEKAILAVVLGTRKLPHYFQAHTVVVLTQLPLKTELYVDGAANRKGSGVGLVLTSPEGIIIEKSLRLDFGATNNEAEYEALLMGMVMVRKMGGKAVNVFSDSRLVVGQVQGEFETKDERMQGYLSRVNRLQGEFEFFSLLHVSRSSNAHADSLATLATSSDQDLPRIILVEDLHEPTGIGGEAIQVHQIRESSCWMDDLIGFLKDDILPEERKEADKIRRRAARFWLSEDQKLYKRSYSGPYLLCIHPEATESLLEELHEGICESHTEGRSLAHRALTQGYWWPSMQEEARDYAKKCDQCG
nr:uncharacterized protein LOC112015532 [Quercus suber]